MQNTFISTLFSNTLNLCSFVNVRDEVSHLQNNTQNVILYILIPFSPHLHVLDGADSTSP